MRISLIYCALTGLFALSCGGDGASRPTDTPKEQTTPVIRETPTKPLVKEHPVPRVGLTNLNNTCFANSSINVLFSATTVQNALNAPLKKLAESQEAFLARLQFHKAAKALFVARQKGQPKLCNELNAFFDAFHKARQVIIRPSSPGDLDKIRTNQADAQEFMLNILEFLDIKGPELFTYYKFLDGKTKISTLTPYTMLSVPLSKNTIKDIITKWLEPELMTGNNKFELSPGVKVDAYRHEALKHPLPASFIVHLLRYESDPTTGGINRLSNKVQPDKNLTLTARDYSDVNKTYKQNYALKGITIHIGTTPHGGHYYAYIFDSSKKQWVKFDDSSVSEVSETVVMDDAVKNGYVFLYEKI